MLVQHSISRPESKAKFARTAQLPIHFDPGICMHFDEHVGNLSNVGSPPTPEKIYDDNGFIGQAFMGS